MLTLCAHSREFFDLVKLKEIVCAHGLKALRECLKPALDTDPLVVVPACLKVPAVSAETAEPRERTPRNAPKP